MQIKFYLIENIVSNVSEILEALNERLAIRMPDDIDVESFFVKPEGITNKIDVAEKDIEYTSDKVENVINVLNEIDYTNKNVIHILVLDIALTKLQESGEKYHCDEARKIAMSYCDDGVNNKKILFQTGYGESRVVWADRLRWKGTKKNFEFISKSVFSDADDRTNEILNALIKMVGNLNAD